MIKCLLVCGLLSLIPLKCIPKAKRPAQPAPEAGVAYGIRRVVYDENKIRVQGTLTRIKQYTRLGLDIKKAVDDQGTPLRFKAMHLFWAKEMCLELVFFCERPGIQSIDLEVMLITEEGERQTAGAFEVRRGVERDYLFKD